MFMVLHTQTENKVTYQRTKFKITDHQNLVNQISENGSPTHSYVDADRLEVISFVQSL